ncbi:MAG: dockerin type I repeat-containing protein [Planctomycetota bacterium]|nr:dockerin type I repeat-containing protein [Planctomycetota bacterium]
MTARTKALFFCFSLFAAAFPSTAKATVGLEIGEVDLDAYTVEIIIESSQPVRGFQFDVTGFTISGISGGLAEEAGFDVFFSETRVLGFSMEGNSVPHTDGVLLMITFAEITGSEGCLENMILAGPGGQPLDVLEGECVSLDREMVRFIRGDANDDAQVNLTDAVFILSHLFMGEDTPPCLAAADSTGNRALDLSDSVFLLNYLFIGGDAPPAPFPGCGALEMAEDDLPCESADSCGA